MFYDDKDTLYTHAYLSGEIISQDLNGVEIEMSFTPQGKMLASFQPKDFLQVSRLDMRSLLARAIEYAVGPHALLKSSDNIVLVFKPKT